MGEALVGSLAKEKEGQGSRMGKVRRGEMNEGRKEKEVKEGREGDRGRRERREIEPRHVLNHRAT